MRVQRTVTLTRRLGPNVDETGGDGVGYQPAPAFVCRGTWNYSHAYDTVPNSYPTSGQLGGNGTLNVALLAPAVTGDPATVEAVIEYDLPDKFSGYTLLIQGYEPKIVEVVTGISQDVVRAVWRSYGLDEAASITLGVTQCERIPGPDGRGTVYRANWRAAQYEQSILSGSGFVGRLNTLKTECGAWSGGTVTLGSSDPFRPVDDVVEFDAKDLPPGVLSFSVREGFPGGVFAEVRQDIYLAPVAILEVAPLQVDGVPSETLYRMDGARSFAVGLSQDDPQLAWEWLPAGTSTPASTARPSYDWDASSLIESYQNAGIETATLLMRLRLSRSDYPTTGRVLAGSGPLVLSHLAQQILVIEIGGGRLVSGLHDPSGIALLATMRGAVGSRSLIIETHDGRAAGGAAARHQEAQLTAYRAPYLLQVLGTPHKYLQAQHIATREWHLLQASDIWGSDWSLVSKPWDSNTKDAVGAAIPGTMLSARIEKTSKQVQLKISTNEGASWATLPDVGASGASLAMFTNGSTRFYLLNGDVWAKYSDDRGQTWLDL